MLAEFQVSLQESLHNMQLPAPELINFYKNLENRILWIDSEIAEHCLEYAKYILAWNAEDDQMGVPISDRKPIKLMIFSGGGDLNVTNSIIDIIDISKTPVYGYNMNSAFSGACYIFMKCHKRFALKKSTFLIHQGSASDFAGTYEQILAAVFEYQRQIEELSEFILENSKISKEVLEENIATEWFVTASQAVEYGFCDEIIENINSIIG